MKSRVIVSAAALASIAGFAVAAPTIDGAKSSDPYGAILWTQNQPTSYGDNLAGVIGTPGDPENVRTGVEIAIPMSAIGNPGLSIKLAGFINGQGHDFIANQIIGTLPPNGANPGEPRNVNWTTLAGNQFITMNLDRISGAAPVMDGSAGGADATKYGAAKFTQGNFTGFGNNVNTTGVVGGGSEIDGVFAVVHDNGTAGDTTDDVLYITFAGNLESNFNKLDLFFDSIAGGQNRLLGNNLDVDFNGLNRMGEFPVGTGGNGLRFDAGFEADFFIGATTGNVGGGPPSNYNLFVNYATLPTAGAGTGGFAGQGTPIPAPVLPATHDVLNAGGTVTGGTAGVTLLCSIDNANIIGVGGSPVGLTLPNRDVSSGSEIDGVFGYAVQDGYLYLLVTGNLQNSGNHLDLFFNVDGTTEGQNTLLGPSLVGGGNNGIEFDGLNRMGNSAPASGDGLTFDTGFGADYWLTVTNSGYPVTIYANAAVLHLNGPDHDGSNYVLDYGAYDGGLKSEHDPITFSGPLRQVQEQNFADLLTNYGPRLSRAVATNLTAVPDSRAILVSVDNNNVAGVTAHDAPVPSVAGAAAVTTGVEIAIRLDELGWDGVSPIRVAGFINNNDHSIISNQLIGGLPGFPPAYLNLGEPRGNNLGLIAGDQWVEIPLRCPADLDDDGDFGTGFNPDGGVDINDLLTFLSGFENGDLGVDIDNDGDTAQSVPDEAVDINDLLFFLGRFELGC